VTEISFRFNVGDRIDYACRYLRKAVALGSRAVATGPSAVLAQLDRALWTFEATEFVPHLLLRRGEAPAPRLAASPVWLLEEPAAAAHHEVLVNLGELPPPGFESFSRLIEIVATDDADRAAARLRWRHYQARGYTLQSHALGD
jgi:DNA polymerase-3 subunit chi